MIRRFAVDASAIVAILNREAASDQLEEVLIRDGAVIGAPSLLEVHIWVSRRMDAYSTPWLDAWLSEQNTQVIGFDGQLERIAARAFGRFGKGLHPAKLNYGDCMAYAVAVAAELPLLFKGSDFGKTDVAVHPASVTT